MIGSLKGTLLAKLPTEVVLDVHGIGFQVNIPLSTFEVLGEINSTVLLLTHLHVREDALHLYGFATDDERMMFRLLISVTGIGPKMAQGILSGIPVRDLRMHLVTGNSGALTTIPGVGRKLAERLIVELREKLGKLEGPTFTPGATDPESRARAEALLALTSLGYNRLLAEKALRSALQELGDLTPNVENLIKVALRQIAK
jgi:holliday junction DNA helicase RuvA